MINTSDMIRKTITIIATVLFACATAFAQRAVDASVFHPVASQEAQVVIGDARFTVLTSRLIRMEWAADGKFEDRATLGVIDRDL